MGGADMTPVEFEMLSRIEVELTGLRQAFVDHVTMHERDDRRSASRVPAIAAAASLIGAAVAVATLFLR